MIAEISKLEQALSEMPLQEVEPPDCVICGDSGLEVNREENTCWPCECALKKDKQTILRKLLRELPENINLSGHEKRANQHEAKKFLGTEASKGIWIHGKTDMGKTHLLAMAVRNRILNLPYLIDFKWMKTKKLLDLWVEQYGDNKKKAKEELENIFSVHVIVLDDIDKTGTMTESRESEFFHLVDTLRDKGRIVYASSQYSIEEFCDRMPKEREVTRRDGMGPIAKRFKDLCEEIKI